MMGFIIATNGRLNVMTSSSIYLVDFNFTPNTPVYSICMGKSRTLVNLDGLEKPPPTDIIDAISGTSPASQELIEKHVLQAFVDVDRKLWNEQLRKIIKQFEEESEMFSIYSNYSRLDETHLTETGEPRYTNFCHTFQGTLDYIFLIRKKQHDSPKSSSKLLPSHLLSIPDETFLSRSIALPNDIFGSDHISLMCKLYLLEPSLK
jgi:hypothetical protein